jgi:hypothetical protein
MIDGHKMSDFPKGSAMSDTPDLEKAPNIRLRPLESERCERAVELHIPHG